ncbi:BZ3500_MvSof-1268-A1-R1_Chr11-3g03569 [Microbotryum saponariae]|uniref:BZ3500_MvSof-1268-A1-R1_Chr11-3g03569 protein n=1 Tax=Microbotryum saponariae TaxID=289078 RepID=A0A2X0LF70_9BASI|nr:BZ3500_MvSof-1268-A1-R1_Chr11-3g03569 [Microbotryum saponariae]SDA03578.1 BZ3501_MvSof-1269-A2-R1_Chr11g03146 [Microbotryum saponariae]
MAKAKIESSPDPKLDDDQALMPELEPVDTPPPLDFARFPSTSTRDDDVELVAQRSSPVPRAGGGHGHGRTPSYMHSQYETIVRRQRARTGKGELKLPPRYLRQPGVGDQATHHPGDPDLAHPPGEATEHAPKVIREFDFVGWGQVEFLEITNDETERARKQRTAQMDRDGENSLGKWSASGVAGVAVAGSPLYAFPTLVGVASIYSPISLLIATLLLSVWRPIMIELASAFPIDGSNYIYMLNSSTTKTFAIVACALTLLDDVCTAVVGAATGAAYIPVEWNVPWMTVILIIAVTLIALSGVKGSAEVTTAILIFHLLTLAMLALFGIVHWAKEGNGVLRSNWIDHQAVGAGQVVKQIFLGVCVAFLGVTGFETAPDYISSVRKGCYPTVLTSLQVIAVWINAPLMLVTLAVLPLDDILGVDSVLKSVASRACGRWLSLWISVDAVLILGATVLSGIVSADALLCRIAEDGLFPRFLLHRLPRTGAPWVALTFFCIGCLVVYASTGASLPILSGIFAIVFLSIMALYPIASLLASYHRPYLPRTPRASLWLNLLALSLTLTFVGGNLYIAPGTNSIFFAYATVLILGLVVLSKRSRGMKVVWWVVDQTGWMKRWGWDRSVVGWMKRLRTGPVLLFVSTDEVSAFILNRDSLQRTSLISVPVVFLFLFPQVNKLFDMVSYIRSNEETSHVKLVYCYLSIHSIPSELEANYKILDESFPSITIDLLLVQGNFSPELVDALVVRTGVESLSRCFVGCFTERSKAGWEAFGGVRIVAA